MVINIVVIVMCTILAVLHIFSCCSCHGKQQTLPDAPASQQRHPPQGCQEAKLPVSGQVLLTWSYQEVRQADIVWNIVFLSSSWTLNSACWGHVSSNTSSEEYLFGGTQSTPMVPSQHWSRTAHFTYWWISNKPGRRLPLHIFKPLCSPFFLSPSE